MRVCCRNPGYEPEGGAAHRHGGRPVLETPFYGSRRMTACLERAGETVNRKRVHRLMKLMGLEALHPKPPTTTAAPDAWAYPYLLRDRVLTHADEVWSSDITYVLTWRLSNTLEERFCLKALDEAR